jgi:hypothetical protein
MKKETKLIVALLLMIVSSIFSGAVVKEWYFLYEFELELFDPLVRNGQYIYAFITITIAICHVIIFSLPLLTRKRYFKWLLIIAPLIIIILFTVVSGLIFFLLIPFIICWIIAMAQQRKLTKFPPTSESPRY